MKISKTDCFHIITIHNDQISDLYTGLTTKNKIHAPTKKKISICFIIYKPYRKKEITRIYHKKT